MEETTAPKRTVLDYFAPLKDPRIERTKRHQLLDIIVIALCGIICGAESWVEIVEFGKAKLAWLKQVLPLPNGIPSHDTFGRVFARLDPQAFQACFLQWVQAMSDRTHGEIVAIDGKTLRRSFDRARHQSPLHLVSAWACQNRLVLGQCKTDDHSNEITAIPHLLQLLDLTGCVVTVDALGTQKTIAQAITTAQADYVLALKGNHETAFEEVRTFLDDWAPTHPPVETVEKDHGRLEVRRYWLSSDIAWFEDQAAWPGLTSFGMVDAQRTINGHAQTQRRYYFSSLPSAELPRFAEAVRAHWSIENSVHWTLDVCFDEDRSRVRKQHAPENLALLRRMALNLLKRETSRQGGIKVRRLRAACDTDYLAQLLLQI
jgi:predicted transposase YbfD/YdcC